VDALVYAPSDAAVAYVDRDAAGYGDCDSYADFGSNRDGGRHGARYACADQYA
jgi:hypothetical protein